MLGYGPEDKSAVLELTYNYGVTEYDKGNAYAQVSGNSSFLLFFFYGIF
jgi:lactoylglutathione lyase